MWEYFYYESCPACQTIHDFMISISGTYDIHFNDVWSDWWTYAKSIGVSKVPSLYNGVDIFVLGSLSPTEIETLLTT